MPHLIPAHHEIRKHDSTNKTKIKIKEPKCFEFEFKPHQVNDSSQSNQVTDHLVSQKWFFTLEAWRLTRSRRGWRWAFPWRRWTLGRPLMSPWSRQSLEEEVLQREPPVGPCPKRKNEFGKEGNDRGFKYPRIRTRSDIVRADRTLSNRDSLSWRVEETWDFWRKRLRFEWIAFILIIYILRYIDIYR
jgi:hypothetical protein